MAHHILIVDDSATTRAIIKRTVQLAGLGDVRVSEAGNGKLAIDLIAKDPADLVLADLHMPEMDGVTMTRHLLADPKTRSIPVLVVTAEPDVKKLEELKKSGVRGYVRKPFTPETIKKAVLEHLAVAHA